MTLLRCLVLYAFASAGFVWTALAEAAPRLALIIDQTNYTGDLSRVALASAEADHISRALATTGFEITRRSNLSKSELEDALGDFRAALEASGPGTIAFVYYTGHGLQHPQSGDSYLLGTDARLKTASDLAVYGLDLQSQRDGFAATGAQAVFLVFDACRNVPPLSGFKGNKKGIGRLEAEPDMLIAYSTRLNDVAEEGVYAPILAEELTRPGQTAETAFTAAQRRVQQSTRRKQRPYTDMDLSNEVCFAGCNVSAVAGALATRAGVPPSELKEGNVFRDILKDGSEGPEMIVLPPGEFRMGSSLIEMGRQADEGMVRTVQIPSVNAAVSADQAFAVSKFEVTWAQYAQCSNAGACRSMPPVFLDEMSMTAFGMSWDDYGKCAQKLSCQPTHLAFSSRPVYGVSWHEAVAYTEFLSKQTGKSYRLLSEAEWEYAARAGTAGRFHNGSDESDLCSIANTADSANSFAADKNTLCADPFPSSIAPVGQFEPNAFGLHDMHGNVWEWTADCYHPSYDGAASDGRARTVCDTTDRVMRGGSYQTSPANSRSSTRNRAPPEMAYNDIGFRIARDLN